MMKIIQRPQLYDWTKSFKEGRTEVENMQRLYLVQGKLWPEIFWYSQGVLFINFSYRTTNYKRRLLLEAS